MSPRPLVGVVAPRQRGPPLRTRPSPPVRVPGPDVDPLLLHLQLDAGHRPRRVQPQQLPVEFDVLHGGAATLLGVCRAAMLPPPVTHSKPGCAKIDIVGRQRAMNRFLSSQFAHYVLWALLLLLFVVVQPRPWSPLFLSLFGLAMALGIWLMWRSHLESVASKRAFATWQARIQSLAPAMDVDDDGHLYEWLDPPQWEAVFSELERVPSGSRSLRQAMGVVSPMSPR